MLEQMRKGAANWAAKALLFLLVISFGIWGVADYLRVRPETTVATVGEATIHAADFSTQYRRELQRVQARLGSAIDAEQAKQLGLPDIVLQRMIEWALFDQAGRQMGLRASDTAVRLEIEANPTFRSPLGTFDRLTFEAALREQGFTEAGFVAAVKRDLIREQIADSLVAGISTAPDALVDRLFRYRNEKRVAEYLVVASTAIKDVPEPDEALIAAYHKDNAGRFTAPELRAMSWVAMTPQDVLGDIQVSDQEIRDEYDARQKSFVTPERRTIEQAVYSTEAAAREALQAIRGGADFAETAEKTLNLKRADLALGKLTREELPPALATPVFGLPLNQVSEPIRSPLGWHVARVTAIEPGHTRTLDEVREELKRELALVHAADRLVKVRDQFDDRIAGGATLEEAAQAAGLKVRKVAAMDARGQDAAGKPIADLPAYSRFLAAVFSAPERGEPEIHETEDRGYLAFQVDTITAAALRPLAAVRNDVIAAWKAEQRAAAAGKKAQEIAARLKEGGDLQGLAQSVGSAVELSPALDRTGRGGEHKLSPQVLAELFRVLIVGGVVTGPTAAGDGQVVARLARIDAADPGASAAERERLKQAIAGGIADDLFAEYRNALERRFGVTVNRTVLEGAL